MQKFKYTAICGLKIRLREGAVPQYYVGNGRWIDFRPIKAPLRRQDDRPVLKLVSSR